MPRKVLWDVVAYWRDRFDWRAAERRLNGLPQFTIEIDGRIIHYLHVKGVDQKSASLVLTHGWPNPLGLVGISAVDIRDIAEAAASTLMSDKHFGKTYNLNGPAMLSGPKVASIWTKVLGKEIKYAGDNLDIFEVQMRKHAPAWAAFDIRMMFQGYLERGFVAEDDDAAILTKLLGHEPRAYEDFANEIMREWQMLANPRAAA